MAAQFKTRCPHCGAQFRISEDHLKQANGAVRCGSCLKVFQASENLVKEAPAAAPAKRAAPAKPAARPAARAAAQAKAAQPAKPAQKPATKSSGPEQWSLPQEEKPAAAASKWTLDDSSAASEDKSTPLDRDFDDKSVTRNEYKGNDTRISLGGAELSDSFMNIGEEDDESLTSENFSDMAGAPRGEDGGGDESWAEKLLEELDDEPAETKPSAQPPKDDTPRKPAKPATAAPANSTAGDDDWATEADDFFGGMDLDEPASMDMQPLDDDDDDDLGAIELPQVEARKPVRASLPRPDISGLDVGDMIKWAALSAAGLLVLGVQYLAFNFGELARTPEWRGFYSTVCGAVGCSLPNPSDTRKLHASNLVVRDHPVVEGALVVDVIVFNEGDYPQPFPVLELGFSSLQGRPLAGRRFSPDEYRQGELARMDQMPVGVPVHVSFEIMDPGPDAVNYTLMFRPAPQQNNG